MKRSRSEVGVSFILVLLVCMSFPAVVCGDTLGGDAQRGVSHYQRQEYDDAARSFASAHSKDPDNSTLAYNLANSKYKSGKFEDALGSYAKSMNDVHLKQQSLYNTGNALYRMGKLEEAAASFKKALELDPRDMDSKFNLEFTREQLKKKQKQQNKSEQNPQQSDSDKNQKQQENDSNGRSDQSNQDKQQPSQGKSDPKPSENQNKPSQQAAANTSEMSKEEAEQWLRSLDENQKKFVQRQIQDKLKKEKEPVGKDW